ncbi:PTS sugar transporter subunit IIA [Lactiplantibacillus pentosus]|uniref:PTS sugar transporter subunit IIA n=1 Tax=Lactiplantibacillus pentosus TaxID=1589 RepID=UPI0035CFAEBD
MVVKAILSNDAIQVVTHINDWKSAIKLASQPLLKAKMISSIYVENMIASVNSNGPYMVLTDYFALMHARPGVGVSRAGMSLLVTKQAVDLAGKPVKVFLILAAKDNTSHLEWLQAIMSIFMDEQKYRRILTGNREQIAKLFN